MPNSPATIRICTTFAPVTFRERNSRSGMSGLAAVAWRATKPAKSASDTAPRISVRAEPKPCSLACTIV